MEPIQMEDQIQVANFWQQLTKFLYAVKVDPENSELINQIDQFISNTTEYDWEYGPSTVTDFYFCLSPNLREDLVADVIG